MAPPPPPPLPPELIDDAVAEILIRIPPDEPADLFRASLVCKIWLRVASDPAFLRRYRAFHRGAPLLGFFHNRKLGRSPRFFSTAAGSPLPQRASVRRASAVLDCRHGRVLCAKKGSRDFLVWDPIADGWSELPAPDTWYTFCSAVVLCAVAGCDHRDCHGGPFLVVYVGNNYAHEATHACVYSSEAGAWDRPVSAHLGAIYFCDIERAALIGDGIYWTVAMGARILKYDLAKHCFSLIGSPAMYYKHDPVLMENEDGSLGFANVRDSRLYLWSWMVNSEGVYEWVQQRVIELKKIGVLPRNKPWIHANVIGFAEGVGVFFMGTDVATFTFELNTGRVRKIISGRKKYCSIFPFISFCTLDCGRINLPLPAETN